MVDVLTSGNMVGSDDMFTFTQRIGNVALRRNGTNPATPVSYSWLPIACNNSSSVYTTTRASFFLSQIESRCDLEIDNFIFGFIVFIDGQVYASSRLGRDYNAPTNRRPGMLLPETGYLRCIRTCGVQSAYIDI